MDGARLGPRRRGPAPAPIEPAPADPPKADERRDVEEDDGVRFLDPLGEDVVVLRVRDPRRAASSRRWTASHSSSGVGTQPGLPEQRVEVEHADPEPAPELGGETRLPGSRQGRMTAIRFTRSSLGRGSPELMRGNF